MYRLCSASLSRSLENRYSAVAAQLASRAHMQVVLAAEGNNSNINKFFFLSVEMEQIRWKVRPG